MCPDYPVSVVIMILDSMSYQRRNSMCIPINRWIHLLSSPIKAPTDWFFLSKRFASTHLQLEIWLSFSTKFIRLFVSLQFDTNWFDQDVWYHSFTVIFDNHQAIWNPPENFPNFLRWNDKCFEKVCRCFNLILRAIIDMVRMRYHVHCRVEWGGKYWIEVIICITLKLVSSIQCR